MNNTLGSFLGGANQIALYNQQNQSAYQQQFRLDQGWHYDALRRQQNADLSRLEFLQAFLPPPKQASPASCQGCGAWGVGTCEYCGNQIKRGK